MSRVKMNTAQIKSFRDITVVKSSALRAGENVLKYGTVYL